MFVNIYKLNIPSILYIFLYKNIKYYIMGVLDIDNIDNVDFQKEVIFENVKQFIMDNYRVHLVDFEYTYNEDRGVYIINQKHPLRDYVLFSGPGESLTNGLFEWGFIYSFAVSQAPNITSLKGCPRQCHIFTCNRCDKLKSLEGSPQICDDYSCTDCHNLKSLKGVPQYLGKLIVDRTNIKDFTDGPVNCDVVYAIDCKKLTSFKGMSPHCKTINANGSSNLESLVGLPRRMDKLYLANTGIKNLEDGPWSYSILDVANCSKLESTKGLAEDCQSLNICLCNNLTELADLGRDLRRLSMANCEKYKLSKERLINIKMSSPLVSIDF